MHGMKGYGITYHRGIRDIDDHKDAHGHTSFILTFSKESFYDLNPSVRP